MRKVKIAEGGGLMNQTHKYEKPYFKKEKTMNFPMEIINSLGSKIVCKQCSSCHGCQ